MEFIIHDLRDIVNKFFDKDIGKVSDRKANSNSNTNIDIITFQCYNDKKDVIKEVAMDQYIKSVLVCDIQKRSYDLPHKMPQYLLNSYSFQKYMIGTQECLFVAPVEFSFTGYKKQRQKIKQVTGLPVVLQLKSITKYQRKVLIEEHIPFVVENSQIYLPFLAILLNEKFEEVEEIEKFTPITQLVFLYIFYHREKISATDLAQKVKCTAMSVSRAYKALIGCGLFHPETDGVKKYIVPNSEGGELLNNAEPYFINPIDKIIYVRKDFQLDERIASGIYALSEKTMIDAAEEDKCYAVYRKKNVNSIDHASKISYIVGNALKLEKWSYDPSILAQDGVVDDISLILSLKNRAN